MRSLTCQIHDHFGQGLADSHTQKVGLITLTLIILYVVIMLTVILTAGLRRALSLAEEEADPRTPLTSR